MEASEKQREGSAMDQAGGTESGTIDSVLAHNRAFVAGGEFARYATDKYPDKKLAVVSCMDTRAHRASGSGARVEERRREDHQGGRRRGGASLRQRHAPRLLIAACELGVEDIMVVAHTNCGAQHMSGAAMIDSMRRLGVSDERIEFARIAASTSTAGSPGFGDTEESVRKSVDLILNHPVMPPHVRVAGFVMDSVTGELVPVA